METYNYELARVNKTSYQAVVLLLNSWHCVGCKKPNGKAIDTQHRIKISAKLYPRKCCRSDHVLGISNKMQVYRHVTECIAGWITTKSSRIVCIAHLYMTSFILSRLLDYHVMFKSIHIQVVQNGAKKWIKVPAVRSGFPLRPYIHKAQIETMSGKLIRLIGLENTETMPKTDFDTMVKKLHSRNADYLFVTDYNYLPLARIAKTFPYCAVVSIPKELKIETEFTRVIHLDTSVQYTPYFQLSGTHNRMCSFSTLLAAM